MMPALVESAWNYRHSPCTGKLKQYALKELHAPDKDFAWKAQIRLCTRCRVLASRGKHLTIPVTAVARGLAGFVWAIEREVKPVW